MKILVIDSHKGTEEEVPTNLHWTNARQIADYLGGDLIWSTPSVNDEIKGGYDKIIFVHASPYCQVDKEWLSASPDADLFYVTNEYNLGEPRILWQPAKNGRHYTVIANHEAAISKVVKKYTKDWQKVNLNSLVFNPRRELEVDMLSTPRKGIIYYGSYRKGREASFRKYLNSDKLVISTHPRNKENFQYIGCFGLFISRINWNRRGLMDFAASLYLEDDVTHKSYNYLANRFYEALNYRTPTIFSAECENTIEMCGYNIPDNLVVSDPDQYENAEAYIPYEWEQRAWKEKDQTMKQIERIVNGN